MSFTADALIDLTGYSGASDKVNLSLVTSQPRLGAGILFTAGVNINIGQPVIYDYSSGVVTAITAGSLPSQHEYIGIALETVAAGGIVSVLTKGVVTARRDTSFIAASETVTLNSINNATTRNLTNATTFTDSGAIGDYVNNENYSITFDAQFGYTAKVTVNDIEFEHGDFYMWDRLGIQGSTDGVNFFNLSEPWLQTSLFSSPTWDEEFAGGNEWNDVGSNNGYIFPKDNARAELLLSGTFPVVINTGYRHIRFYFRSDGSTAAQGWNMTLAPDTPYTSSAITVAEGATLYLDNSDYTKITTNNASQIVVGYCAYSNAENNSIFIRI